MPTQASGSRTTTSWGALSNMVSVLDRDPPERASRSREHGRANVHPEGNGYPELRPAAVSGERSGGRQTLGDVANASGACRIIRGMSHCFRKLLIIANPVAQNGEGKACAYRARALLASALGEDAFALEFTERPGQASDIAARAASRGFDCVCALEIRRAHV